MHRSSVVVASDSFKGSLSSAGVGHALRLGLLDVVPGASVGVVPVADGGEGTVAGVVAAGWGAVPVAASGPTGEPSRATIATDGRWPPRVLVELATVCGLERLPGGVPAPLTASSRGFGEAVRAALDLGPSALLLGVGGSASSDGGAGMLAALGARIVDRDGHDVADGGAGLARAHHLDLSGLDPRLSGVEVALLADVDNPLLGPDGAAAVFGPQKGADSGGVAVLESALARWAHVVEAAVRDPSAQRPRRGSVPRRPAAREMPGAGAAGGVGFALLAVLGARRRSGIDAVLDLLDLDGALRGTDLVVTGEGSLDEQTLRGKAVMGVAERARASGVPVVAVCGRCTLSPEEVRSLGVRAAYPLSDLEPVPARSMSGASDLLRLTGRRIAADWLSRPDA